MLNPQDSTAELKKYLRKLLNIIENEASITLIKTKIIDKTKIDDILCCIEASFPEEYKAFIKKKGARKLKSNFYYNQLLASIKNKFLFSTSCYSVRYKEAAQIIGTLVVSLDSDMRFLFSDASGMF